MRTLNIIQSTRTQLKHLAHTVVGAVFLTGSARAEEMIVNVQFWGQSQPLPAMHNNTQGPVASAVTTPAWNVFGADRDGGVNIGANIRTTRTAPGFGSTVITPVALVQADGTAAAVQFYQSTATGAFNRSHTDGDISLFDNGFYDGDQANWTITSVFTGLTVGQKYDLYAMQGRGGEMWASAIYTVTGAATTALTMPESTGGTSAYTADNTVHFIDLLPDATGKLTIVLSKPASAGGDYFCGTSGFQLVRVGVPAITPVIAVGEVPLAAVSTIYGTASTETSFTVSGTDMLEGILVTPPAGFEVSQTSGSGFAAATTVGDAGTIAATTVYVRLAATAPATGSYNGQDIRLTSLSASPVNVITAANDNTVSPKALAVTAMGPVNKGYGTTLTTGTSTDFTATGEVNGELVTSVTLTPTGPGVPDTAATGTAYIITPSAATGSGGFLASNYDITYTPYADGAVVIGTPVLSVTNSPVLYDGLSHAALISASVAGGPPTDVKYNGSSDVPTAVGTYAVTADFAPADPTNYTTLNDAPVGNFVIALPEMIINVQFYSSADSFPSMTDVQGPVASVDATPTWNQFTGTGNADQNWNNQLTLFADGGPVALVQADNTASAVTLSIGGTGTRRPASWGGEGTGGIRIFGGGAYVDISGRPQTSVFSGLAVDGKYDLYVMNAAGSTGDMRVTVNGDTAGAVRLRGTVAAFPGPFDGTTVWTDFITTTSDGAGDDPMLGSTANTAYFKELTPDADGRITIDAINANTHRNDDFSPIGVAGFQLVRIPESTTMDLLAFHWGGCAGVIDQTAGTVSLTVPFGTDPATLNPVCTVSSGATVAPVSGSTVDFTNSQATPVNYTVTAKNGVTTRIYQVTVTVTAPSTACDITGFNWDSHAGVIDGTHIALSLPSGVDLATLNPTFTVSAGATCDHVSGNTYDFSAAVFYIVTAQDGVTTRTYTVTVGDPFTEWIATFDFAAFTNPDLTAAGDPDGDGITNIVEFAYGLDPSHNEDFTNCLTRERWEEIDGIHVTDLTGNRERFLAGSNECVLVPGVDESGHGDQYASRYRGFLIAPLTGIYYFWISGDDGAELWLADGSIKKSVGGQTTGLTNRYGKQLIASNRDPLTGQNHTLFQDFDQFSCQHSGSIQLQAGQKYYFEVLHKQHGGADHVAVAWQVPGATRQIIPATAFNGNDTQADDLDDDNLPDAWEVANGLNPADNGRANPHDGQYGDWDNDGLTNLEEYQLGTNPKSADTDGDGISDKDERDYYHSDPLVQNLLIPGPFATVDLTSFTRTSVPWQIRADGSALAYERRGWTDYPFTITPGEEGIYEIRITGGAEGGSVRRVEDLPLSLHLNGALLARQTLRCLLGQNTTVKQLTPWLGVGTYALRIENHNVRADCKLRLNSITFQRLGGTDANNNRIPDWAEQKLSDENHLTRIPSTSRTSPVCIEGITSSLQSLQILKAVTDDNGQPATQPQEVLESTNGGFFSNIPLDPAAATALTIHYQNGMLEDTPAITWIPTDLSAQTTLHIRQGDSLRLDAWNNAGNPDATKSFTVTLDGTLLTDSQGATNHTAGRPFTATFNTPGEHTLVVNSPSNPPHTVTLHVHHADFGPAFDVQTYTPRTWTRAGVNGMAIETNDDIDWYEITAADAATRSFSVNVYETGTSHVIARLPETGDIIARGTLQAFNVSRANETGDTQLVLIRPDGSHVYRFTIVAENLPANAEVRLCTYFQGAIFSNGSRDLTLRAADFSSNGIADVFIEWGDDSVHKICHTVTTVIVD